MTSYMPGNYHQEARYDQNADGQEVGDRGAYDRGIKRARAAQEQADYTKLLRE
jgi:hypothetical protein